MVILPDMNLETFTLHYFTVYPTFFGFSTFFEKYIEIAHWESEFNGLTMFLRI